MEKQSKKLEFYLGAFGRLAPLLTAALIILWAAVNGSNVNGYVIAFFAALIVGVLFAKDDKAYGDAIVQGLCKPMFGVITLSVILAAISGKLISESGVVQTIASFLLMTKETDGSISPESVTETAANPLSLIMLVVPVTIVILCLMRKHLITALSCGIMAGVAAGMLSGIYGLSDLVDFPGGFSVSGMIISAVSGTAGTVAMLIAVFALLGVMESSGLFEDVGKVLKRFAKSGRSTEAAIVLSTGILSMITGVISVAIVALGNLVNDIGEKAGVDKYRRANLLDCTGCVFCFLAPWTVHCVIPAQQSAQFGDVFAVAPASVPFVNYYSICMLVILVVSIITGYGRNSSAKK